MKTTKPYITILIPVYNERRNITPLYGEIKQAMHNLTNGYEILFIDDGSTDGSYSEIEKLHKEDSSVKVIRFKRNFGKAAGLSAGFEYAQGSLIITIDGDLQDDPQEIPKFIREINKGYDMVVGWRVHRRDPKTKRIFSKLFNKLTNLITGARLHDANCGFKIVKREAVESLNIYGELHRYIPALVHMNGGHVGEVLVKHRPRKFGKSKYNLARLFKGFFDLITVRIIATYKKRPFHLFGFLGSFFLLVGFALGLLLVYLVQIKHQLIIRPLFFFVVLILIVGVQLISTGLLGEILVSTQKESNKFYIKTSLGIKK